MMQFGEETIIPLGGGCYLLESWTYPDEHHHVDSADGTCSCIGFQCAKYCRHLEAIRDFEREYRRYREATQPMEDPDLRSNRPEVR